MILAASAAKLHPSYTSLLNRSSISSFHLQRKHRNFQVLFSVLHFEPFSKVHLTLHIAAFSFCPHLMAASTFLEPPLSSCILRSALLAASLSLPHYCLVVLHAVLTLIQLCSTNRKRKNHFPNFPKVCLALGRLSFLLFFCFLFPFCLSPPSSEKNCDKVLALLPPFSFPYTCSPSFSFSVSSSTFHPSASLELATFPLDGYFLQRFLAPYPGCFFLGYSGPFTGCFLQRSLGRSPGCFFFLTFGGLHSFPLIPQRLLSS